MKKHIPIWIISIILISGACLFLYPIISTFLFQMTASTSISNYRNAVKNLPKKEITKLKSEAQKYNELLSSGKISGKGLSFKKQIDSNYLKFLNAGSVIGYLEIPKINVYLPIFFGNEKDTLQKGIGHLSNTSLPIGGPGTHAVLTGHRGLPSATLLTNLDQLSKGDMFYIHILNEILAYKVDQILVVDPENTTDLTIQPGKDYITLVTCTPYGINTQRLLVRGARVPYTPSAAMKSQTITNEATIVPAAALLLVILLPIFLIRIGKKEKKVR